MPPDPDPQDPPKPPPSDPPKPPVAPGEAHPGGGPTPEPPPASKTVLEGTKGEKDAALERKLKERELRVSELEDENHRLKTIPPVPDPPPPPKPKKKEWLKGWTFFDRED